VHRLKASPSPRGHEQAGRRYAIVVQADAVMHASTWFVVPTSTSAGAARHRPEITVAGESACAMCDQAASIDPQVRLGEVVDQLRRGDPILVEDALRLLIDL
jgi:mRNA interferase MazF